ncbi:hypothetical protein PHMEG_00018337 [Phytophthora megakarya]|uniref:Uncharacterized protein n=1 Tax=Phytophthora megakarya TaxID=4795 RepID=A0A225VU96_9STRA|nr:hypothetical protein PHMEG_00018337 [Phytophthora megakarya]
MRSSEDAAMETSLYMLLPAPDILVNRYDATHPGKARCDAGSLSDLKTTRCSKPLTSSPMCTLASCLYNWFILGLWNAAGQKNNSLSADLKAAVSIMIMQQNEIRDGVVYLMYKQRVWTLAEGLATKPNLAHAGMDGKNGSKTMGSLLKR